MTGNCRELLNMYVGSGKACSLTRLSNLSLFLCCAFIGRLWSSSIILHCQICLAFFLLKVNVNRFKLNRLPKTRNAG